MALVSALALLTVALFCSPLPACLPPKSERNETPEPMPKWMPMPLACTMLLIASEMSYTSRGATATHHKIVVHLPISTACGISSHERRPRDSRPKTSSPGFQAIWNIIRLNPGHKQCHRVFNSSSFRHRCSLRFVCMCVQKLQVFCSCGKLALDQLGIALCCYSSQLTLAATFCPAQPGDQPCNTSSPTKRSL